jgi:hypothetical protein
MRRKRGDSMRAVVTFLLKGYKMRNDVISLLLRKNAVSFLSLRGNK